MFNLHIDLDFDGDVQIVSNDLAAIHELAELIEMWKSDRDAARDCEECTEEEYEEDESEDDESEDDEYEDEDEDEDEDEE